jgi:hypothetical protein
LGLDASEVAVYFACVVMFSLENTFGFGAPEVVRKSNLKKKKVARGLEHL